MSNLMSTTTKTSSRTVTAKRVTTPKIAKPKPAKKVIDVGLLLGTAFIKMVYAAYADMDHDELKVTYSEKEYITYAWYKDSNVIDRGSKPKDRFTITVPARKHLLELFKVYQTNVLMIGEDTLDLEALKSQMDIDVMFTVCEPEEGTHLSDPECVSNDLRVLCLGQLSANQILKPETKDVLLRVFFTTIRTLALQACTMYCEERKKTINDFAIRGLLRQVGFSDGFIKDLADKIDQKDDEQAEENEDKQAQPDNANADSKDADTNVADTKNVKAEKL